MRRLPTPLTPALLEDMTRYTDRIVAQKYSLGHSTVTHLRKRHGISHRIYLSSSPDRPTITQQLLTLLAHHPEGVQQRTLAARFGVTRQAITDALRRLARYGVVCWAWEPPTEQARRRHSRPMYKRWFAVREEGL